MGAIKSLGSISIDCPDPHSLAAFYARLLGTEVALEGDGYSSVQFGETWINMLHVPDFRRPSWPESSTPQQVHLDFAVDDLDEAEQMAVAAGAELASVQPEPEHWRVLIDPAGHPFCLTTNSAE
ncbi:MAG TPA: VOC family protein [Acidimicrobiales bacterium]|nr:VOC family protein [Acidimicrobiales bacterium]